MNSLQFYHWQRAFYVWAVCLSLFVCAYNLTLADGLSLTTRDHWTVLGPAFNKVPTESGVLADSSPPWAKGDAKGVLRSATFEIAKPYVNFQIAGGDAAFRTAFNVWVDGRVVRTATGEGSAQWLERHFDVREFIGKKAFLELVDQDGSPQGFLRVGQVALSDTAQGTACGDVDAALKQARAQARAKIEQYAPSAKADPRRPVWHMRPPAGRLNDANGPFFADGYYHLFYQFNPFIDGYMMWGHVRSKDLINWEHLPVALWPGWERGEYHCYSGSAFMVDGKPQLFYTYVPATVFPRDQWKAVPTDAEYTMWEKPAINPLISFKAGEVEGMMPSVRDPFLFEADGRVFMLLCGNDIYLYEAQDSALNTWVYRSKLWEKKDGERGAECPNFFRFGDRWVLLYSPFGPVRYQTGIFDTKTGNFAVEREGMLNHASGYYATTGTVDGQGRTILYGHLKGMVGASDSKKVGWRDVLALPRVLELAEDGTLRMYPVPEAQGLRGEKLVQLEDVAIGKDGLRVPKLEGDVLELTALIRPEKGTHSLGVRVRADAQGQGGVALVYDVEKQTLFVPGPHAVPIALPLKDGLLDLHLFLDKSILEVFAGQGRVAEVRVINKVATQDRAIVFFADGPAEVQSLDAWALKPTPEGDIDAIFGQE